MKKLLYSFVVLVAFVSVLVVGQHSTRGASVSPSDFGLREGDTVSATGSLDPDIYIINQNGYKRLFLNPVIFKMYGHLKGFAAVKSISSTTRDAFVTSTLFKNCETNDGVVYAVEVSGEDTGVLHRLNISHDTAIYQDPSFDKKTFCINNNEFNWYPKGQPYDSLSQVGQYFRSVNDPVLDAMMLETQKRMFPYEIFSNATLQSIQVRFGGNIAESSGEMNFNSSYTATADNSQSKSIGNISLENFYATSTGKSPLSVGPVTFNYRVVGDSVYVQPTALNGLQNVSSYLNQWYQVTLNDILGSYIPANTNTSGARTLIMNFLHDESLKPGAQAIIAAHPLFVVRADLGTDAVYSQTTRHVTVSLNKANLEAFIHATADYVVQQGVYARFIDVLKQAGYLAYYTDAQIATAKDVTAQELATYHEEIRQSFASGEMDSFVNFPVDLWVAPDYDIEKMALTFPLDSFGTSGKLMFSVSSYPAQDMSQATAPYGATMFKGSPFASALSAELNRIFSY